jgi:hypothetical protein
MESIYEPLVLLLICVYVIGSIPSPRSELVEILHHTHAPLLQVEELSLIILKSPEGIWALWNLALKASQVITWFSGCMVRTFSHHAPAAPARKWVVTSQNFGM